MGHGPGGMAASRRAYVRPMDEAAMRPNAGGSLMTRIAAAIAICAVTCLPSATMAQDRGVELGVLDCAISGGTGFIVGTTKDLRCTFNPADTTSV